MSDPPTSKLPAPFGKYLLTELIAVGGMAEVYRAKIFGASGFEKEMVVKRILPKYARNPNFVQMLIDEAKIAVSLSHGNIVPIYELGEFEGSYYIAMEFVEGRTVLDILRDAHSKKHPLPWPYCLGLAAEVAKGLAYAHTRTDNSGRPLGLVHRDINPRNIVITPAGEVRILDFGIARASTKRHQTASGVIKGTPGYMSPEQMYGQPVDARSDIYCLGILVYELLTLRRLFPVWDVNEMRSVFEAGPIPLPSSIARHVSKEVDTVIMKALTQNVNDRFQSASDFEEELRTTIARSGTAVTASGLAREIRAVDDAPGPRAPKTAPPVIESSASRPTIPMRASTGNVRALPDGASAPVAVKIATGHEGTAPGMRAAAIPQSGVSPDAATRTQRAIDGRPVTEQIPADQAAMAADALLRAQSGAVNAEGPKTQPMPLTRTGSGPALAVDAAHSFVISLAEPLRRSSLAPVEPLPSSSAAAHGHRAMVLAKNETLDWASNVGADAEMLALMKATGSAPGTGRRTLAAAAIALCVVAAVAYVLAGDDIGRMVQRALAGQAAELGVVTVKTIPSGAEVSLDGRVRGKTNMKITGVDINEGHTLVVTPKDKPAIEVKVERSQFQPGEDGRPTFIFERDFTPAAKP